MPKRQNIFIGSLIVLISGFSILAYGQVGDVKDDRNLNLRSNIPTDFGFFTKKDIEKAYSDMKNNCDNRNNESKIVDFNTPESCYLFDHLVHVGLLKLQGNELVVSPDASAVELKKLIERTKNGAGNNDIITPAELKSKYDALRGREDLDVGQKSKTNGGYYKGSSGLYPKYLSLCDLARGLYFNTTELIETKEGSTTIIINDKYNKCKEYTKELIANEQNSQRTTIEVVKSDVQTKTSQAIIANAQANNEQILTTLEQGKNNSVNILKKAGSGGPMVMCNES